MSYLITNLTSKTPGEDFLTSIHATPAHSSLAVSTVNETLRRSLSNAKRIVVKAGTGIVTEPNGVPSLSRIGAIVEQICWLRKSGKEVILVSSGAVGIGRQLIRRQMMMKSFEERIPVTPEDVEGIKSRWYNSTAAGAGQLGLLSLYETLFHQWDVAISQLLLTEFDFRSQDRYHYINSTLTKLLKVGVVPILNENDAVSGNTGYFVRDGAFSDNDGLASLVAAQMKADLLILLTDVEGLYTLPPHDPNARVISHYTSSLQFSLGDKSEQGRGGMAAKIQAALQAVEKGVGAVVIASGKQPRTLQQILQGDNVGTLFMNNALTAKPQALPKVKKTNHAIRDMAIRARDAGRLLQALSGAERDAILNRIADGLLANADRILAANKEDMEAAQQNKVAEELVKRLKITPQKLETLAKGIRAIAASGDPIGKVTARTEIASGLVLSKTTVPIGCILVIFESRPDSLPQICSLCLRTGNGLLLKGGKEAAASNSVLYTIVGNAIEEATKGKIPRDVIGLVSGRTDVSELLTMSDVIDLVIPRGSGSMVSSIKKSTQIPVLGHAEGICHVYVDQYADMKKAISICEDGKTDYPAACNSMETLLIHGALCTPPTLNREPVAVQLLSELRQAGVKLLSGPVAEDKLSLYFPFDGKVESFRTEYGEKTLSVEVVEDLESAVDHIHRYGSSHTEVIVTENKEIGNSFLRLVDAACVFWNASPRFADGYRFGLGAEVGISTGRIHSRGPVGAEGLLTVKWVLESSSAHVVNGDRGVVYTHKSLPFTAAKL